MKSILYVCAGAVALGAVASANAEFIDFEGLSTGDFVTNQLAGQGISSVSTSTPCCTTEMRDISGRP